MPTNRLKYELQAVLSGKSPVSHGTFIQAVARYLKSGPPTSPMAQEDQYHKQQEAQRLTAYAEQHSCWVDKIDFSNFIAQGAEQRVFIRDKKHVYKLNDTIYYASWVDYLHNLLLNNFFFPDTLPNYF